MVEWINTTKMQIGKRKAVITLEISGLIFIIEFFL